MITAARCAWLAFVDAHRWEAALIPLLGFLVLVLFSLFQERIGRLPRRIFQVGAVVFICAGLAVVIYESLQPQDCPASAARLERDDFLRIVIAL
jgi:phosphoglycerol transferase MdoB-like AlkP superfamily enzyme